GVFSSSCGLCISIRPFRIIFRRNVRLDSSPALRYLQCALSLRPELSLRAALPNDNPRTYLSGYARCRPILDHLESARGNAWECSGVLKSFESEPLVRRISIQAPVKLQGNTRLVDIVSFKN